MIKDAKPLSLVLIDTKDIKPGLRIYDSQNKKPSLFEVVTITNGFMNLKMIRKGGIIRYVKSITGLYQFTLANGSWYIEE